MASNAIKHNSLIQCIMNVNFMSSLTRHTLENKVIQSNKTPYSISIVNVNFTSSINRLHGKIIQSNKAVLLNACSSSNPTRQHDKII